MITYEKFSIQSIKTRTLFTKKMLNQLGYNLIEDVHDDKPFKKALKDFQVKNGFGGNCVASRDVFNCFTEQVPNYNDLWEQMKH